MQLNDRSLLRAQCSIDGVRCDAEPGATIVGIDAGIISTEVAPFGGIKKSGIGREGARQGLDEFMEVKYMCMGSLTS
jgi:acyl-CoA reductase-like NAD-dependent aldehyde dehydrogenase|tara:strand:+ start:258 stop:488 length:231 start_codon:yes stop_codon:yes gene_type:complete